MQSPLINELIEAFKLLPTIGPKSAQRMAYYLLQNNPNGGKRLAEAIVEAIDKVGHCGQCRNFSETDVCRICASPARKRDQLCIVETPTDVVAIEQSGIYQGLYFVLMGHLSPIDGVGPEDLGLPLLEERLKEGEVSELIWRPIRPWKARRPHIISIRWQPRCRCRSRVWRRVFRWAASWNISTVERSVRPLPGEKRFSVA